MPSTEKLDKLRTLYIQRETLWKQLDGVLTEIGVLLREEPDYQAWLDSGGQDSKLPEWIHGVTGGRPLWLAEKTHVKRQKEKKDKPQDKQQELANAMFTNLMKGFK